MASLLGYSTGPIPKDWYHTAEVLKSKPGTSNQEELPETKRGCFTGDPLFTGNSM